MIYNFLFVVVVFNNKQTKFIEYNIYFHVEQEIKALLSIWIKKKVRLGINLSI